LMTRGRAEWNDARQRRPRRTGRASRARKAVHLAFVWFDSNYVYLSLCLPYLQIGARLVISCPVLGWTGLRSANALNQIERSQEERSMRWKCKACRYIKHFTKAVPLVGVLGVKIRSLKLFCEMI